MGTAFLGQYILLHKTSIAIKLNTAKKDKTTEGCMKFVQMAYKLAVHFFFMVRKMFDATIPSTGEKKKKTTRQRATRRYWGSLQTCSVGTRRQRATRRYWG